MTRRVEIVGGADPETAAAIMAAVARVAEEQAAAAAVPPVRPAQGPWVLSTRPRPVQAVAAARPAPVPDGWSVNSEDGLDD
jgi:hypothetical protein